jgi:hypothetical protein
MAGQRVRLPSGITGGNEVRRVWLPDGSPHYYRIHISLVRTGVHNSSVTGGSVVHYSIVLHSHQVAYNVYG